RAVYYVDDYYWVYGDGGVWYRSRTYDGGWVTVDVNVIPRVIVSRSPGTYIHYHGDVSAKVRVAPRFQVAPSNAAAHHEPPGHDDIPGVGNQRKAEGEQRGRPTHVGDDDVSSVPKGDPPGQLHKGENSQGQNEKGNGPPPQQTNKKKDDKKKK